MEWCYNYLTIPVIRKCCFCVPVRKGVIIFGYVNLVLALLAVPALIFEIIEEITSSEEHSLPDQLNVPLTFMLLLADTIMYIVMLVGAHKRNKCILKGYLYFGLFWQAISLAQDLAYIDFQDYTENTAFFIFLSLNLYLLLLVYSTIRVIEESFVHYVTHQNQR